MCWGGGGPRSSSGARGREREREDEYHGPRERRTNGVDVCGRGDARVKKVDVFPEVSKRNGRGAGGWGRVVAVGVR